MSPAMTFRLSIVPPSITIGPYSATLDGLGFIAGKNEGTPGAWECGWTRLVGWTSSPIGSLLPHGYPHFPDPAASPSDLTNPARR